MSDLLQSGAAWLADQRRRFMTHMVTYQRGALSITVPATRGRTLFEQADEYGIVQRTESADYLISTADLIFGLDPSEPPPIPKAGDRIRETIGAQTFVYEVMAPGNEPPWRWSDPYHKTLRIHTKHVATE